MTASPNFDCVAMVLMRLISQAMTPFVANMLSGAHADVVKAVGADRMAQAWESTREAAGDTLLEAVHAEFSPLLDSVNVVGRDRVLVLRTVVAVATYIPGDTIPADAPPSEYFLMTAAWRDIYGAAHPADTVWFSPSDDKESSDSDELDALFDMDDDEFSDDDGADEDDCEDDCEDGEDDDDAAAGAEGADEDLGLSDVTEGNCPPAPPQPPTVHHVRFVDDIPVTEVGMSASTFAQATAVAAQWSALAQPALSDGEQSLLAAFILSECQTGAPVFRGRLAGTIRQYFEGIPAAICEEDGELRVAKGSLMYDVLHRVYCSEESDTGATTPGQAFHTLVSIVLADDASRARVSSHILSALGGPSADVRTVFGEGAQYAPSALARPARPTRPAHDAHGAPASATLTTLLAQLHAMPGLSQVKRVVDEQVALLSVNAHRKVCGLPPVSLNMHMVFTGSPGTGKTTVARLIGKIFAELGVLSSGHTVEVDRSGLIGKYLGSTVAKTSAAVRKAKGGVLFVDEAYALSESGFSNGDAFGQEAVNTLVKAMEDHRENLVVIFAGYQQEMADFIASNTGLASRIGTTVPFADYTADELSAIASFVATERGVEFTDDALELSRDVFRTSLDSDVFGNGRGVRNFVEACAIAHAVRLSASTAPITRQTLTMLTADDVAGARTRMHDMAAQSTRRSPVGFLAHI